VRLRARREALGPVQALMVGIDEPGADRALAAELQDLRTQDAVRVVDMLRVRRGEDGEIGRLDPAETEDRDEGGRLVEALLRCDRAEADARGGAPAEDGGEEEEGAWFLGERIPRGAAVAILLIEHRWAIPLREALAGFEAAGGDAWLHPGDIAAARAVMRRP